MATYDIDGFVSHMGSRGGPARSNDFVVYVACEGVVNNQKNGLSTMTKITAEDLAMQVQSVDMPTKALLTKEIFTQNIPNPIGYNLQYSDLTINFLLDSYTNGMTIWSFYNAWVNMVVNPVTSYVGYKKDYSCPIYVSTVAQSTPKVKTPRSPDASFGFPENLQYKPIAIEFIDAFPKSIGNVTLDYSSGDAVKFPVTFSIKQFEDVKFDKSMLPRGVNAGVQGSSN